MPYSLLKISRTDDDQIEVVGEFNEESDAYKLVEESRLGDPDDEYEYIVEVPPSRSLTARTR